MSEPQPTLSELLRQADELAEKIKQAKARELESCRIDALALIQKRGFTIAEIFPEIGNSPSRRRARKEQEPPTDGRSTVPPKYRNPDNPAETWTGRGRQPKWVTMKLALGVAMDSLKIG